MDAWPDPQILLKIRPALFFSTIYNSPSSARIELTEKFTKLLPPPEYQILIISTKPLKYSRGNFF